MNYEDNGGSEVGPIAGIEMQAIGGGMYVNSDTLTYYLSFVVNQVRYKYFKICLILLHFPIRRLPDAHMKVFETGFTDSRLVSLLAALAYVYSQWQCSSSSMVPFSSSISPENS
jgi:hypothetical protein